MPTYIPDSTVFDIILFSPLLDDINFSSPSSSRPRPRTTRSLPDPRLKHDYDTRKINQRNKKDKVYRNCTRATAKEGWYCDCTRAARRGKYCDYAGAATRQEYVVVVVEWRRKEDDIVVMELEWRQEKRLRTPTTRGFDARAVVRETNFPMTARR